MIKKNVNLIILTFLFIFVIQFISADGNLSIQQQAESCLQDSKGILNELMQNNFSYQRIQDSLNKAQDLYSAQVTLIQKGEKVDFSLVIPYCEEIKKIRNLAFDISDQYLSLKKFYNISITSEMNASQVEVIFLEIENEISSERYEKVPSLIDSAYEEITKVRYSYTTLNLFYSSTTRSLKKFFKENWLTIVIISFVLFVSFLIFRKKIRKHILENKIDNLELRRKTLQDLIKETQKDYFQHGKISENSYNLRTKKFAEFVRDIDREVPLLKEEIAKIKGIKKTK